jgi:hypothetical protein
MPSGTVTYRPHILATCMSKAHQGFVEAVRYTSIRAKLGSASDRVWFDRDLLVFRDRWAWSSLLM